MLVGAQMEAAGRQGRKGGRIGDSVCERSLHIIESSEPKVGEGTLARIQEKPVSERAPPAARARSYPRDRDHFSK